MSARSRSQPWFRAPGDRWEAAAAAERQSMVQRHLDAFGCYVEPNLAPMPFAPEVLALRWTTGDGCDAMAVPVVRCGKPVAADRATMDGVLLLCALHAREHDNGHMVQRWTQARADEAARLDRECAEYEAAETERGRQKEARIAEAERLAPAKLATASRATRALLRVEWQPSEYEDYCPCCGAEVDHDLECELHNELVDCGFVDRADREAARVLLGKLGSR